MIQILIGKIQLSFLAQFLPASLLDISDATRAQKCGAWMGKDYNLDGDEQ
jgi:hypothetical protein